MAEPRSPAASHAGNRGRAADSASEAAPAEAPAPSGGGTGGGGGVPLFGAGCCLACALWCPRAHAAPPTGPAVFEAVRAEWCARTGGGAPAASGPRRAVLRCVRRATEQRHATAPPPASRPRLATCRPDAGYDDLTEPGVPVPLAARARGRLTSLAPLVGILRKQAALACVHSPTLPPLPPSAPALEAQEVVELLLDVWEEEGLL